MIRASGAGDPAGVAESAFAVSLAVSLRPPPQASARTRAESVRRAGLAVAIRYIVDSRQGGDRMSDGRLRKDSRIRLRVSGPRLLRRTCRARHLVGPDLPGVEAAGRGRHPLGGLGANRLGAALGAGRGEPGDEE